MQEESLTIEHGRNWKGKEKMTDKISTCSEELCKMLRERKLETRTEKEKSTLINQNVTLIEEALMHVKIKRF